MAKVEARSESKGIPISQLPIYSNPKPKIYEEVDDAGAITTTLRRWVSPITHAMVPGLTYVRAGRQRATEIGQTGYAHTMTSVEMIKDDPYGPASIAGGAASGVLLGIRGGKIIKAVLAVSGAAVGGYVYYWEPYKASAKVFNNIKEQVEGYIYPSEKKETPEKPALTEKTTDS
ncbi:uncharacterized protein LOC110450929 [Mizuhopecten yessoensis]|uniref:MICOS complex subunit n=1 Tax=Mizuhopecten yessoensis TaxID=6573 RepID=A0A210QMW0_MIZYE|nr:uncharacterized protein LOC110450929 [Mizuhopecten yessoensis]OWF50074.1 hypothetical protein KP79_PYT23472 [Mizuhopecten yessoensis]